MNPIPWNEIHWHDTIIRKVILLPESAQVVLHVDYPVDWDADRFERRIIRFTDAFGYREMEGPIIGAPAILGASSVSQEKGWHLIRLETSAGYREVCYQSLSLETCADA